MAIKPVELPHFYRLINHGPTTMISAKHNGIENVMSAAWVCAVDFAPKAKLSIVVDKANYTRGLIEQSGWFAVQVPVAAQIDLVMQMGKSRKYNAEKLADVPLFYQEGFDVPLVEGCAAWIVCKLINEPHNQQEHDLFIGEVMGAWADDRIFNDNMWQFDDVPDELRTLHYISDGKGFLIGKSVEMK